MLFVLGSLVALAAVAQTKCPDNTDSKEQSQCVESKLWRSAAATRTAAGTGTASTRNKLVDFVDSNGCRLRVSGASAKRLKEIAAQGSVTWDGACKDGLIAGNGVLRQEGTLETEGKKKKFAYYLSGNAKNGVRSGKWKRETFDMFIGSPKYWTSAATINYVDGDAKGPPKPFPVRSQNQLSPSFRKLLAEANREAEAANMALQQASAAPAEERKPPPKVQAAVASAPASAATPAAEARKPEPKAQVPVAVAPTATAQYVVVDKLRNCWVDQINEKVVGRDAATVTSGQDIRVVGWAVDSISKTVPEQAWVELISTQTRKKFRSPVSRSDGERPDVVQALGEPKFIKPGFRVNISTRNLAVGDYTLTVVQEVGSDILICHHKPMITVRKK